MLQPAPKMVGDSRVAVCKSICRKFGEACCELRGACDLRGCPGVLPPNPPLLHLPRPWHDMAAVLAPRPANFCFPLFTLPFGYEDKPSSCRGSPMTAPDGPCVNEKIFVGNVA